MKNQNLEWHKVLDSAEDLPEGRVRSVTAAHRNFCLTKFEGKISCLDNACPHQGGPLGEGSIENGLLRCPWHGWDFHPVTGKAPGFDDGVDVFPVEHRDDGVYVGLAPEKEHVETVSDVMVRTMTNWGVKVVFGMVGHSNLGLADAMRRAERRGDLRYFGIRHEGAASFAASAYGKLTGRPAACFAIAGPGSTNMYTGMWDAKVDRAPLLALTGQVATQVVGTGNFQELDLVRAFDSVAEFNHRVQATSRHAELMNLAIKHAILGRDVSHLTFPDEIQILPLPDKQPGGPQGRMPDTGILPAPEILDQAMKAINGSKRPLIIVGHGARFHMSAIIQFAERLHCPVVTTFKGKGQIPDSHPLAGGVLGRSGTPVASWFMNEADVLVVLGASFSKHTGITPKKKIIQVDFDPLAVAKFHQVAVPVLGEISQTVRLFTELLQDNDRPDQGSEIARRWSIWRAEKARRLGEEKGMGVSSAAVFDAMNQTVPDDAVLCVDVGNNAYAFGRYYEAKSGNSFLMSGYLGSIGFAYPAALGAWAAVGDQRPVVAVAGDGGLMQYLGEINTAVLYDMPIKLIVMNNYELGKISKEQRASNYDVWQTALNNPSFADFANSCGALGIKVESSDRLLAAMSHAFEHDGPAVVEVLTDPDLL